MLPSRYGGIPVFEIPKLCNSAPSESVSVLPGKPSHRTCNTLSITSVFKTARVPLLRCHVLLDASHTDRSMTSESLQASLPSFSFTSSTRGTANKRQI